MDLGKLVKQPIDIVVFIYKLKEGNATLLSLNLNN